VPAQQKARHLPRDSPALHLNVVGERDKQLRNVPRGGPAIKRGVSLGVCRQFNRRIELSPTNIAQIIFENAQFSLRAGIR
jgi:hypothetical protein